MVSHLDQRLIKLSNLASQLGPGISCLHLLFNISIYYETTLHGSWSGKQNPVLRKVHEDIRSQEEKFR